MRSCQRCLSLGLYDDFHLAIRTSGLSKLRSVINQIKERTTFYHFLTITLKGGYERHFGYILHRCPFDLSAADYDRYEKKAIRHNQVGILLILRKASSSLSRSLVKLVAIGLMNNRKECLKAITGLPEWLTFTSRRESILFAQSLIYINSQLDQTTLCYEACRLGLVDVIPFLASQGYMLNEACLVVAAKRSHLTCLEYIVQYRPDLVWLRSVNTAICQAALAGKRDVISYLMKLRVHRLDDIIAEIERSETDNKGVIQIDFIKKEEVKLGFP